MLQSNYFNPQTHTERSLRKSHVVKKLEQLVQKTTLLNEDLLIFWPKYNLRPLSLNYNPGPSNDWYLHCSRWRVKGQHCSAAALFCDSDWNHCSHYSENPKQSCLQKRGIGKPPSLSVEKGNYTWTKTQKATGRIKTQQCHASLTYYKVIWVTTAGSRAVQSGNSAFKSVPQIHLNYTLNNLDYQKAAWIIHRFSGKPDIYLRFNLTENTAKC